LLTASNSLSGASIPGIPPTRDTLTLICDELYGRIQMTLSIHKQAPGFLGHQYRAFDPQSRSQYRSKIRQAKRHRAKPRRMGLPLERPTHSTMVPSTNSCNVNDLQWSQTKWSRTMLIASAKLHQVLRHPCTSSKAGLLTWMCRKKHLAHAPVSAQ
jgi:hypothetical protein